MDYKDNIFETGERPDVEDPFWIDVIIQFLVKNRHFSSIYGKETIHTGGKDNIFEISEGLLDPFEMCIIIQFLAEM